TTARYRPSLHDALPILPANGHEETTVGAEVVHVNQDVRRRETRLLTELTNGAGRVSLVRAEAAARDLGHPSLARIAPLLHESDRSEEHTSELQSRENLV